MCWDGIFLIARYTFVNVAQTKHQIETLLAEARSRPRHQFGQNFMIDQNLVRTVAEAGDLGPGDCAIEVGPGTGTLTEELLERAGRVVVVEIDRDLAGLLDKRYADRAGFQLIEGDALAGKHDLNAALLDSIASAARDGLRPKLVANLPYNIASPLVIGMLIAGVELLAFTVQKEVAQRLAAKPGTSEYGPLTVMAQLLSRVEVLRTIPPQVFWPPPKIESSLVRLRRDDLVGAAARDLGRFVHALFSFRRKTLRRGLAQAGFDAERMLSTLNMDGQQRAEEFEPAIFLRMFEAAAGRHD